MDTNQSLARDGSAVLSQRDASAPIVAPSKWAGKILQRFAAEWALHPSK